LSLRAEGVAIAGKVKNQKSKVKMQNDRGKFENEPFLPFEL